MRFAVGICVVAGEPKRAREIVEFVLKLPMVLQRSCVMVSPLLTTEVQPDEGDEKMCEV